MSNLQGRVKKLEESHGTGQRYKYMCVIFPEWANWDTPEERAKGFKIQCNTIATGGTGGDPFYLATQEELDAFAARPDVSLAIIRVLFEDEPIEQEL